MNDNQPAFSFPKSLHDFHSQIATPPAIKNLHKKIKDRFSKQNRSVIFPEKTLRDISEKIGSRSKQPPAPAANVVRWFRAHMHRWLTFHNRIAIFLGKTHPDFSGKIDPRFFFCNRYRDRD